MSKKLFNIVFICLLILIFLLPNFVCAAEISMNLTNSNTNVVTNTNVAGNSIVSSNFNTSTIDNDDYDNDSYYSSSNLDSELAGVPEFQTTTSSSSVVESLSSLPEASLGLTNILSIILIVIGVLLILLAIAILIRLG